MPLFGYARVSTRDQDLATQNAELMAAGCAKVFKEKVSGAKTDRPELAKVIGRLEPGDVLVVTRLDRLARSTRDLLNVIAAISDRGAGFKSLKDAWADTTTAHGRLMLAVLGGLAEFERELIRERRAELERRALEHLGPITDEMRAKVLCEVIAAAQRNPGGPEAEKLRRFCEDPECRAWFEKMWRDVSQETGPDALTRSILGMQSEETFGDASRGTERH